MGVTKLLDLVQPLRSNVPIMDYGKNKTLEIDMSVWFHLFAYVNARSVVAYKDYSKMGRSIKARLKKLLQAGVAVYVVFDSDIGFSGKKTTDEQMNRKREEALAQIEAQPAMEMVPNAIFQQAVKITSDMKRYIIDEVLEPLMQNCDIEYTAAIGEADSQLVHMFREGQIDATFFETLGREIFF